MRIFNNLYTNKEKEKLNTWREELHENILGLEQIIVQHDDVNMIHGYKEYDKKKAWTKINKQLKSRNSSFTILKIAASLSLLIFCAYILRGYISSEDPSNIQIVASEKMEIELPDGSKIIMDQNSRLEYNALSFKKQRQISFLGRAKFEVVANKNNPFVVTTDQISVEVLGTVFEVNTIEEVQRVIVNEGKVAIKYEGQSKILHKGEMATLKNQNLSFETVQSENMQSWINDNLIFEFAKMSQVIQDLSNHFNYNFQLDSTTVDLNCHISTKFKLQTLPSILEEFNLLFGAEFQIKDKTVYLSHLQCD